MPASLLGTFDEHSHSFADQRLVVFSTDARLQRQQVGVALALNGLRHVVGEAVDRHRAGARAVLEDEAVLEPTPFGEGERLLKVGVGLGREADDKVAGERDVRHVLAGPADERFVLVGGVAAVHRLEDAVAAALGGDVQVPTDPLAVAHRLQRLVGKIAGVTSHEPQPRQVRRGLVDTVKQFGKGRQPAVRAAVGVVVDGLAEQRDLAHAGVGEANHFLDDVRRRAVHFGPASVGDDAVGAELVAPASDADVGLGGAVGAVVGAEAAGKVQRLEMILRRRERAAAAAGRAHQRRLARLPGDGGVVDQSRQPVQLAGPAEQVDLRELGEQVCPVALGHAADYADHQARVGFFTLLQLAESGPDLLLGMLAHAAGVVEDDVCGVAVLGGLVPLAVELRQNQFAVQHVHLATEGFEVELFALSRHGRKV